jgi:hypothetical protein
LVPRWRKIRAEFPLHPDIKRAALDATRANARSVAATAHMR